MSSSDSHNHVGPQSIAPFGWYVLPLPLPRLFLSFVCFGLSCVFPVIWPVYRILTHTTAAAKQPKLPRPAPQMYEHHARRSSVPILPPHPQSPSALLGSSGHHGSPRSSPNLPRPTPHTGQYERPARVAGQLPLTRAISPVSVHARGGCFFTTTVLTDASLGDRGIPSCGRCRAAHRACTRGYKFRVRSGTSLRQPQTSI